MWAELKEEIVAEYQRLRAKSTETQSKKTGVESYKNDRDGVRSETFTIPDVFTSVNTFFLYSESCQGSCCETEAGSSGLCCCSGFSSFQGCDWLYGCCDSSLVS